jgi:hypothetical protein
MASSTNERVAKRRQKLRAKGLRPIQIWIPDTRASGFAEECRRQSLIVAKSDKSDLELQSFMDAAWVDLFSDEALNAST